MAGGDNEQNLLNISTNLLFELNTSGRILYANRKAEQTWQISARKSLRLIDYLDALSVNVIDNALNRVITGNAPCNFILTDRGRLYTAALYPPSSGRLLLCLEDISDRHNLSVKLQKTARRLDFAEKTANLGYWEINTRTRKIYWSAEMYRIFGLPEGRLSPRRNLIREQMLPEDIPLYKAKLRELLVRGRNVDGILRLRRLDGRLIHCSFRAGLIYENHQRLIAGTFQDITAMIETQKELQHAKQQAEELSNAKSYFLAQASHDLRQPMQALKIFIATLLEEKLTSHQHHLAQKIEDSAENLNTLLDNLLDISKIEAGGVDYRPVVFDIGLLVGGLAREYRELAKDKDISFRCVPLHQYVNSDPVLIERVTRNLLNNAFKYTKDKILLGVRRCGKDVCLIVMDNGCGIAPEDIKNIFKDFYQSRQQFCRKKQGAGLGLGIVSRIAGLLKTEVEVKSKLGQGSCFSFKIPQNKTPH